MKITNYFAILKKKYRKYERLFIKSILSALTIWIVFFNFSSSINESKNQNLPHSKVTYALTETEIHHQKLFEPKKYNINCQRLIEWDDIEIQRAILLQTNTSHKIPDENYIFGKDSCRLFKQIREYDTYSISESESDFPLAYSILTYFDVEQFERLLRAIYRSHNFYCIHIDAKSSHKFHLAIQSIAQCFHNVFIASKLESIVYAGFSRLKADLNCMSDLLARSHKWKYLINLASTEYPLRTNYELTQILRLYNGSNDIEVIHRYERKRVEYKWIVSNTSQTLSLAKTNVKKSKVPFNFTIVKGITYCVFSREFVEFALNDQHAKSLLEWSHDTYSPDEWYWATLNHNTQFNPPGGFKHPLNKTVPTKSRFIRWSRSSQKCFGHVRNNICILTYEDLPSLVTRNEFFANKFLLESDALVYQCLEEWLDKRARRQEALSLLNYCGLPFINYKRCLKN